MERSAESHVRRQTTPAGAGRRGIARTALVLLGAEALYQGVWAQFAPRSFYDRFPTSGWGWVASDGPYNEHLVRDVGGLVTALGILALAAALTLSTPVLVTSAVAWLVYAVPHMVYHVSHPVPKMQTVNVVVLASQVLLPLIGLLGISAHRKRHR